MLKPSFTFSSDKGYSSKTAAVGRAISLEASSTRERSFSTESM